MGADPESGADRGREPAVVVVETKLHVPPRRDGLVRRDALVALLAAGASRKLTLVSAPPGSGKTTLLTEWHAVEGDTLPFAWLSLDAEDNDPVRFWSGVIAALRTVRPELGAAATAILGAPGTRPADDVVPLLVNELVAGKRIVLVLDDYHLVHDEEVARSVLWLVEHLPQTLHLVLASRSDPSLPLPRLRARGELTELRGADLRFTAEQAEVLLNTGLGLRLDANAVGRLQSRTEGWAAGLQLAGLSLQGRADPESFIAHFAGDDRHIVDYLGAEVLDRLPGDVRRFLLRTSVLGRLSAPLCAAVSEDAEAARRLEGLERANLFVVPLDANRRWYRYHHLFAELLRQRLELDEPGLEPELHRRAAAWFADHELPEDAIRHALAAGEMPLAADLVALHWSEFFNSGRLGTVSSWLDELPAETVARDTRLWLGRVWTSLDSGRLDDVRPWLNAPGSDGDGGPADWQALLAALHSFKSGELGSAEEAASWVDAAGHGERSEFWRTVALCVGALTLFWRDERERAEEALGRGIALAEKDGNAVATTYLLGYRALIHVESGEYALAAASLDRAAELAARQPELDEHFTAALGHLARGLATDSRDELARSVELARRGAGAIELAYALLALARVELGAGGVAAARDLSLEARTTVEAHADVAALADALTAVERGARVTRVARHPREELSEREVEVLRLLATAMSQREIGGELYVSLNTVKSHAKSIFRKLDVATRADAVARARTLGLL